MTSKKTFNPHSETDEKISIAKKLESKLKKEHTQNSRNLSQLKESLQAAEILQTEITSSWMEVQKEIMKLEDSKLSFEELAKKLQERNNERLVRERECEADFAREDAIKSRHKF